MRPGDVYLYYSRGEKKPTFFGLNNYPVVNGWRKDEKRSFRFSYSVLNGESQGAIKSFHMIVMNCSDFSGLSLKN